MRVLLAPEQDVPVAFRSQVVALHALAWPGGGDGGHDSALTPLSMLLIDGEQVVAALDILSKDLCLGAPLVLRSPAGLVVAEIHERGEHSRGLDE